MVGHLRRPPMIMNVTVMLDVNWCGGDYGIPEKGSELEKQLYDSIAQAVVTALNRGEENGFIHDMEEEISIKVEYVTDINIIRGI